MPKPTPAQNIGRITITHATLLEMKKSPKCSHMTDHRAVNGGPTYKSARVVLQRVSFPECFAKLGAFVAMGFGEHWRVCVLIAPCLAVVAFWKVALINDIAVDMLLVV